MNSGSRRLIIKIVRWGLNTRPFAEFQQEGTMGYALILLLVGQEGSVLWSRTYGGDDYDWFERVAVDEGGRYIVVGPSWLSGNFDPDLWILVVDSASGDTVRSFLIGEPNVFEWPHDILVHDGSYVIAGQKDTLIWAIRVDTSGNVLWENTYGKGDASAVALSPDGYYLLGATVSTDTKSKEFAIVKVDPVDGMLIDSRTYGTSSWDILVDLAVDEEGNCVASGATWDGTYENYLLKFSCTSGDSLWAISFGDAGSNFATGVVADGDYYAISSFSTFGLDSSKLVVARVSAADGSLDWIAEYTGPEKEESGEGIAVSPAGYYVVVGDYNDGDGIWLLKVNPENGDTLWSVVFEDPAGVLSGGVAAGPSGEYVVVGSIEINSTDGLIFKVEGEPPVSMQEHSAYPIRFEIRHDGVMVFNDTDGQIILKIFDVSGRMVRIIRIESRSSREIHLPPGVYMAGWSGGGRVLIVP